MNQPAYILQYNEESGTKAGGGDYLSEGGPKVVTIAQAKFITANTGSQGIEFSFVTEGGQKANYVNVYYAKKGFNGQQGEPIKGGQSVLNALMGLLSIQGLSSQQNGQDYICPELTGKRIGIFFQKKLFTKSDNSEGYSFEIAVPFNPSDNKTLREIVEGKPAQTVERMTASYKDRDERSQGGNSGGYQDQGGYGSGPSPY
ncbi:hypothetical protein [Gilvimarinus chinensis]|uniref:hypothetical protein n=1 Tax=Gilvimarinus chinensis TaxID=396005 RepID=UPI000372772C|nr:hypothetical protein [Gilvimarinus chinensis]